MKPSLCLFLCFLSFPAFAAEQAITIYNQNFAVVREIVPMNLKAGINEVSFAGITAQLEPDSVILRDSVKARDPQGKLELKILEQSYRNDPVSQELVLSLFEGKEIDFVRKEVSKPDQVVRGKVIRSGYVPGGNPVQPVIELDGKMQFQLPGLPLFPSLGDDQILKPTLHWKLNASRAANMDAELAYVTGGLSWEASYNVVQPEKGDLVDLIGWITMKNESGAVSKDANVKLLAGDVHKAQPAAGGGPGIPGLEMAAMAVAEDVVTEKSFDEFHLYTLANLTTLRDKETKQVEFIRATGVKAQRHYIYEFSPALWTTGMGMGLDPEYGIRSGKKIGVYREFKNSKENNLGIPLPKGKVRFYTQDDADHSLQFVGENTVDHTPKDELVRLYVGDSFDLVGERKRVNYQQNEAQHKAEESFEIKLRNRKTEPVEIRVIEHLYRFTNWQIREKNHEFSKTEAQTIEFRVALKPDEEKVITYKVHYSW